MKSRVRSTRDQRVELTPQGVPNPVLHESVAELDTQLAEFFQLDSRAAATKGSSGANQGEHRSPKRFQALVPMPTRVKIVSGDGLLQLDGKDVAHQKSSVQVPDVAQPIKSDVIETDNDWFFVNDQPVICGK